MTEELWVIEPQGMLLGDGHELAKFAPMGENGLTAKVDKEGTIIDIESFNRLYSVETFGTDIFIRRLNMVLANTVVE